MAASASYSSAQFSRPTFSTCPARLSRAANRGCSGLRSRRTRRRAAASSSTSPIDRATPSSPASDARRRSSPTPDRGSTCAGAAPTAPRPSRSRSPITTAVIWHSGPMGSSTSASATAVRATIRRIARRTRRNFSARCCASTSTCRTPTRPAIRSRPTIRFSVADRRRRGPRSGRSDSEIPGATRSTIPRVVAPVRSSSATSDRAAGRKSTTNRADAADATTAGAIAKAPTTTSRRCRSRFSR